MVELVVVDMSAHLRNIGTYVFRMKYEHFVETADQLRVWSVVLVTEVIKHVQEVLRVAVRGLGLIVGPEVLRKVLVHGTMHHKSSVRVNNDADTSPVHSTQRTFQCGAGKQRHIWSVTVQE